MADTFSGLKKTLSIRGSIARKYLQYRKAKNHLKVNHFPAFVDLLVDKRSPVFKKCRAKINELKVHIDSDYCFLDLPEYGNIGDHMIYEGSLEFLNPLPFRRKYEASVKSFQKSQIGKNDMIILQGGGNFGDLWDIHQQFREYIISTFKENKIIIFPQTIYFQNNDNLRNAVSIFSSHPNLTICVRDERSYEIAKNNFTANRILLLPDMASYLNLGVMKNSTSKISKVLYFERSDKELNQNYSFPFIDNITISDWPTYEYNYFSHLSDKHKKSRFYLNEGIIFMANFDLVISTRLHGAIMAMLLSIPTIFLDNSYGKNSTYYKTWLKNKSNCYLADSKKEVKILIEKHFPEAIK